MKKVTCSFILLILLFSLLRPTDAGAQPQLTVKLLLQGYYSGSGQMTPVLYNQHLSVNSSVVDSVTIELHNPDFSLQYSYKGILDLDGNVTMNIDANAAGHSFYIAIRHRSALLTCSSNPVFLNLISTTYDFTLDNQQTYGGNGFYTDDGYFVFFSGCLLYTSDAADD